MRRLRTVGRCVHMYVLYSTVGMMQFKAKVFTKISQSHYVSALYLLPSLLQQR